MKNLLLLLSFLIPLAGPAAAATKPNIIFILADAADPVLETVFVDASRWSMASTGEMK